MQDLPFKSKGNDIDNVHISGDEQPSWPFIPTLGLIYEKREGPYGTYQSAPAAKHMVLPTYIGSRRTLNGNLRGIEL